VRPQNAKIRFLCPATSSTQHQNSRLSCSSSPQLSAQAERLIESCEQCNEEDAQIPFDNILDRVTRSERDGSYSGRTGKVSEVPERDSRKDAY
jgi:hypothetical protein